MLTHLIPAPMDDSQVAAYESEVREGGCVGEVVVGRDLDPWILGRGLDVS